MSQIISSAFQSNPAKPDTDPAAGIAQEVRRIIATPELLDIDTSNLSDEDDLYAAGLTSHGTVNLMLALEEKFDVEFPDAMLRRRTFESVAAIAAAIQSLLDGSAQAGNQPT